MPKRLTPAVAALAACGIATAATHAQEPSPTTLAATVRATPQKAGTTKRPQGVKLGIHAGITTPEGAERPIVTGFEIWTGSGIVYHRDIAPVCPLQTLSTGGPSACPKGSIMGTQTGEAYQADPRSRLRTTLINGPGGTLTIWGVLQNPARVQAAIPGTVVDGKKGAWPHRESWTIPPSLRVVAGIPITLSELSLNYGGKSWAKTYVATTHCPKGGWRWRVRVHTASLKTGAPATLDKRGRVPCHPVS
jgi:hypothetical protein